MDRSISDRKQIMKVLERWENEGGKILIDSAAGNGEIRISEKHRERESGVPALPLLWRSVKSSPVFSK